VQSVADDDVDRRIDQFGTPLLVGRPHASPHFTTFIVL
jgi:hypothetical protein